MGSEENFLRVSKSPDEICDRICARECGCDKNLSLIVYLWYCKGRNGS